MVASSRLISRPDQLYCGWSPISMQQGVRMKGSEMTRLTSVISLFLFLEHQCHADCTLFAQPSTRGVSSNGYPLDHPDRAFLPDYRQVHHARRQQRAIRVHHDDDPGIVGAF